MICPKCGHNQKKKYGYVCGGCKREFVFNPTSGMTDRRWTALLNRVDANGTYWFTRNQLFMSHARLTAAGSFHLPLGIGLVLLLLGCLAWLASTWLGIAVVLLGFGSLAFALHRATAPPPSDELLDIWLRLWQKKESIPRFISQPDLGEPPPEWAEPDIYDYGVERVIIVERDLLVDFLVRNDFHAQHRALVISQSGYPEYLLPVARRILADAPDLKVYVLHDASPAGEQLARRVPSLGLGVQDHPVIDLGLCREEAVRIGRLHVLRPKQIAGPVPIDMLHPKALLGALAVSLEHDVPLAAPLGGLERSEVAALDDDDYIAWASGTTFG